MQKCLVFFLSAVLTLLHRWWRLLRSTVVKYAAGRSRGGSLCGHVQTRPSRAVDDLLDKPGSDSLLDEVLDVGQRSRLVFANEQHQLLLAEAIFENPRARQLLRVRWQSDTVARDCVNLSLFQSFHGRGPSFKSDHFASFQRARDGEFLCVSSDGADPHTWLIYLGTCGELRIRWYQIGIVQLEYWSRPVRDFRPRGIRAKYSSP